MPIGALSPLAALGSLGVGRGPIGRQSSRTSCARGGAREGRQTDGARVASSRSLRPAMHTCSRAIAPANFGGWRGTRFRCQGAGEAAAGAPLGGGVEGGGEGEVSPDPQAETATGENNTKCSHRPTPEELKTMDDGDLQIFLYKLLQLFLNTVKPIIRYSTQFSFANEKWIEKRRRTNWWKRGQGKTIPAGTKSGKLPKSLEPGSGGLRKMIPLGVLFFCTSFNLTILANTKDALMITAPGAGVEAIPFLATYGVLPASIGMMLLYSKIVSVLPSHLVYYATCAPLLAFYLLFATVLFPNAGALHPHAWAEAMALQVPVGLHGLVGIVRNWTYSLFFVAGELWGGVMISLLFWSLANEVCSVNEAKGIYPVLGIAANVALVASGNYLKFVNTLLADAPIGDTVNALIATVMVVSAVMAGAKWYLDGVVGRESGDNGGGGGGKKKKKKSNAREVMTILRSSQKIRNLALLVVGYGISHKLFEVAWKGQLRALCPSPQAYGAVLGDVSTWTGAVTIFLMIAGRYVFQHAGWAWAATATPLVMLVAGGTFFGLSLTGTSLVGGATGAKVAWVAAQAGMVTQVFARASKYSLFDPAKEMVYIEMGKEEKTKGKAAVDLVGSQIGKSGASLLNQALLLTMGSMSASLPIVAGVFGVCIVLWLNAVRQLNANLIAEGGINEPKSEGKPTLLGRLMGA